MAKQHHFKVQTTWTGNKGVGTENYSAYERDHVFSIENKPDLLASADPAFLGDGTKHNPEDLLIASISACHMLWYLHLCASNGITVVGYTDNASGILTVTESNGGHFTEVTLRPTVIITDDTQIDLANELHKEANKKCFIANSCNFPVHHSPDCKVTTN